eukprot:g73514.t1
MQLPFARVVAARLHRRSSCVGCSTTNHYTSRNKQVWLRTKLAYAVPALSAHRPQRAGPDRPDHLPRRAHAVHGGGRGPEYILVDVVIVLTGTPGLIGVMCLFTLYRWHLQCKTFRTSYSAGRNNQHRCGYNLLLSQAGPGKLDFTQGAQPSGYSGGGGGGGSGGHGGGGGGGGAGGRMTGFPAASPAATRNNRPASRGPGGNIRTLFDR